MAEQFSNEGSSSKQGVSGESSDSYVELNVKTLDSRIYHFQVDKNMPVSAFKEKIANEIGLSVGQQRLIFRGKVLKDDHLLSEYHVENGHTLHLVERQVAQSQPSSVSGSGESNSGDAARGTDANAGAPRGRVGQISHSVVLGTFNVGDQGEGVLPDITRVIGTVLNSMGLGNLAQANGGGNTQPPVSLNIPSQGPQGNEREGTQSTAGGQNQTGSHTSSGQTYTIPPFQSLPQVVQIPLAAAAIPVPSLHVPIPDSLNTLIDFMNRMEQSLAQNGYQINSSSTSSTELPSSARGLPTVEALGIVLRHAEQLLSGQAVAALSHIAGRLERDGASLDSTVRGQIQAESSQIGIAMQHLGALLLELGRTMLTLRMGQSPGESFVNAGPAVYISPSGPNPIMVQPFPLQTSPLFGGPVPPGNPVAFGPVGVGNPPRHINIHIHAGTSLTPIVSAAGGRINAGDGPHGERGDANVSNDLGTARPIRSVFSSSIPPHPSGASTASLPQASVVPGSQPQSESSPLSSVIAQINSQLRSLVGDVQEGRQIPQGQAAASAENPSVGPTSASEQVNAMARDGTGQPTVSSTEPRPQSEQRLAASAEDSKVCAASRDALPAASCSTEDAMDSLKSEGGSSSVGGHDVREGTGSVPLGLGFGGLERKRRSKQPKSQPKGEEGEPASTLADTANARANGQQFMQSLLSRVSNPQSTRSSPASGPATNVTSSGGQAPDSQSDVAGIMSQVLHSPALNGLLSGVSQQTGVGSPDVLRNMLQQVTQNPVMMNTVSRIAQQVDSQDLGSMFGQMGSQGGRGGGIDFASMVQQMMPIVSQALGGGSARGQPLHPFNSEPQGQPSYPLRPMDDRASGSINQAELQSVATHIENLSPPEDIYRAIVETAANSHDNDTASADILNTLWSDEDLANEYMEVLRSDLSRRVRDDDSSQG